MLPLPKLEKLKVGGISFYTDNALFDGTGVRIAFSTREGGHSEGAFAGLNLGLHVNDDEGTVLQNRRDLMDALGFPHDGKVISLNQVHGSHVAFLGGAKGDAHVREDELKRVCQECAEGADGIAIAQASIAALLCFADCTPVILASESGSFAVAHAGWRGTVANVVSEAVCALRALDARSHAEGCEINAYIGPHIRSECFEVSEDTRDVFIEAFGQSVEESPMHISMSKAIQIQLAQNGIADNRVLDMGTCTKCNHDEFYSYRASGGVCGRHGAVAFRKSI